MAYFVLYLVLTAFLLAYRPGSTKAEVSPQFRMALIVSVFALIIGALIVIPVRLACTAAFTAAMPEFTRVKDRLSLAGYSDGNYLRIAQGPIQLSDVVVMTVKSHEIGTNKSIGSYWRGRIFDRYTGHGWQASVEYVRVEPYNQSEIDITEQNITHQYGQPPQKTDGMLDQTISARILPNRELYAAAEPVFIESRCRVLSRNGFNSWHGLYSYNGVARYRVISEPPVSDPNKLRKAGTDYPPLVQSLFLQKVIGTYNVGQLAKEITEGINNPYDKVLAIQKYLANNYSYDLNAPPAPPGMDAVNYFLFTSRTGYCDVFASAMVVMCREVGVPARLATGFATGVYDSESDQYKVRDMDRHAWAEVYFPNCGWVTFDPTESTLTNGENWVQHVMKAVRRTLGGIFGGTMAVPLTILLLVSCGVIAFGSEIRSIRLLRRSTAPSKLHAVAVARYSAICRSLRVNDKQLTPIEAVSAGTSASSEARRIAIDAAKMFNEIRYGSKQVTSGDIRQLEKLHKELKAAIKGKN
jgi:transglutaminase-like putative cysteine protease